MTKAIRITICDDSDTILDTYDIDLELISRSTSRDEQIRDEVSEAGVRVLHEIRAALVRLDAAARRRAKTGQVAS